MAERERRNPWWRQHAPLLALLVFNLIIGLLVFDHYGESWDENSIYLYAENSSDAYGTLLSEEELSPRHTGPFNLRFYGPAYFMVSHNFAELIGAIFPTFHFIDLWHFSYFLAFLVALVSLYFLCLRVMSPPAALLATLFFNSQPLLWGHAFVNPKDIPFLAFFTLSVVVGLRMTDAVEARLAEADHEDELNGSLSMALLGVETRKWWIYGATAVAWLLAVAMIYKFSVDFRLQYSVWGMRLAYGLLALAGMALLAHWLLPGLSRSLAARFARFHQRYLPKMVYVAGLALGYAFAIRIIAPAAGGIVAIYLLLRVGRRGLPALLVYFSVALLVMFSLWPFLWQAPLAGLLESAGQMANFPKDIGVLFAGADYRSGDLPWQYFPRLLSAQLTPSLLVLALAGLLLFIGHRESLTRTKSTLLALMAAWFLLPALGLVLLRPTMYDNFRQFLFLLPPLFVFAGFAVERLLSHLRPAWAYVLLALLLLPGLLAIVSLHPYEYTYFNLTAGPRAGLEDRFDTDYWATGYREAIDYLNEHADPDAAIYLYGPDHMLRHFGRPDLVAVYELLSQQTDKSRYDYAVLSTRFGRHESEFPNGEVVYRVMREDILFAVIKRVNVQP